MKITFPHMGNVYIAGKAILEDLGQNVVIPPKCSKRTLELGTKYSPETICLPLKINIGNYIESIEKGADTIIITGSCGPCRFGYYSVLEREILKDLGYDVNVVVFDVLEGNPIEYIKNIINSFNIDNKQNKKASIKGTLDVTQKIIKGKKVLFEADKLTDISNIKRAHAVNSYLVDKIMDGFHNELENIHGSNQILNLINNTINKLNNIEEKDKDDYLKVGIVGEIYTLIEPFVNLDLAKKLGHMGIEVDMALTPTKWVKHHLGIGQFGLSEERKKWKAAKPYLSTLVGGHGRETIGSSVIYSEEGYDGIIQVYPLNCMPEIVAESILPSIQKDYNIPILTLIVDEMTGEAGYLTRIEAFVDLIKRRKEEESNELLLLRS